MRVARAAGGQQLRLASVCAQTDAARCATGRLVIQISFLPEFLPSQTVLALDRPAVARDWLVQEASRQKRTVIRSQRSPPTSFHQKSRSSACLDHCGLFSALFLGRLSPASSLGKACEPILLGRKFQWQLQALGSCHYRAYLTLGPPVQARQRERDELANSYN